MPADAPGPRAGRTGQAQRRAAAPELCAGGQARPSRSAATATPVSSSAPGGRASSCSPSSAGSFATSRERPRRIGSSWRVSPLCSTGRSGRGCRTTASAATRSIPSMPLRPSDRQGQNQSAEQVRLQGERRDVGGPAGSRCIPRRCTEIAGCGANAHCLALSGRAGAQGLWLCCFHRPNPEFAFEARTGNRRLGERHGTFDDDPRHRPEANRGSPNRYLASRSRELALCHKAWLRQTTVSIWRGRHLARILGICSTQLGSVTRGQPDFLLAWRRPNDC